MKKLKNALPFIYLTLVTVWLRLINLGYSDYQGDEIRALYRPQAGQEISNFLLNQRKGPVQFLVTYIIKLFNFAYDNEFFVRLPFALAGIGAVYFFYKFLKLEFGKRIALYSALFMALNGLFVAFARIVQYQSFVILFSILTLYFLSLSTKNKTWKISGLYLGAASWGISILTHFDGIFIAPFVLYLLYRWYKDTNFTLIKSIKIKHLAFSLAIFLAILSVFYVPFFFSISESTKEYWSNRISSRTGSSISTFKLYNPIFVIYLYAILAFLSLSRFKEKLPLLAWFLFPFFAMEILVSQPGTHIYTYIIPLCILISYGLENLDVLIEKNQTKLKFINNWYLKLIIFLLLFSLSHVVFVDNTREYAWEDKRFLMLELPKKHNQSSFGFPYYRHWEEIGTYFQTLEENGYYLTNEKKSIASYYVPANLKNMELEADAAQLSGYTYLIYIKKPQSRNERMLEKEPSFWESKHEPVKTYLNNGRVVAKIYRLSASELEKIRN